MFDEFKSAFQRHNNAHVQLIIINVVVYIVLAVLMVFSSWGDAENLFRIVHNQFSIPADFSTFLQRPWTILTYAFAHDLSGLLHILFNMISLYWFGRLFVEYLGSAKLVDVYVLGAISGAIFYLAAYNTIPFYADKNNVALINMVGASAAINAIVVAVATLIPNYTFFLLFLGPVRIKYIAAVIVFLSFLGTVGQNAGGNIAHLGGALIGFVYMKQLQAGVNWGGWISATLEWIRDLFKSNPKVKVTYRSDEPKPRKAEKVHVSSSSKASQAEIDAILDKISDRGYESLTKEEKEKLFNASKK
jgi:membrane associated rhomboid family serine protease